MWYRWMHATLQHGTGILTVGNLTGLCNETCRDETVGELKYRKTTIRKNTTPFLVWHPWHRQCEFGSSIASWSPKSNFFPFPLSIFGLSVRSQTPESIRFAVVLRSVYSWIGFRKTCLLPEREESEIRFPSVLALPDDLFPILSLQNLFFAFFFFWREGGGGWNFYKTPLKNIFQNMFFFRTLQYV